MKRLAALAFALALGLASAAEAAPTCQRLDGMTVRCATPGAMPVGWAPTEGQKLAWSVSRSGESASDVFGALAFVAVLAALIALMPDFDGWSPDDWDEQEGDRR